MVMSPNPLTYCSPRPSPSWASVSTISTYPAPAKRSKSSSTASVSATWLESLMPCTTGQRSWWPTLTQATQHLPLPTPLVSAPSCRLSENFITLSEESVFELHRQTRWYHSKSIQLKYRCESHKPKAEIDEFAWLLFPYLLCCRSAPSVHV